LRVYGVGLRVQGFRFQVLGFRLRVCANLRHSPDRHQSVRSLPDAETVLSQFKNNYFAEM